MAAAVAGLLTSHDSLRPGSGAYREGGSLGESSGQRRAQSMGMTGLPMLQSSLGFPLVLQPTCLSLFALRLNLCSSPPALFLVPSLRHTVLWYLFPHIWPVNSFGLFV